MQLLFHLVLLACAVGVLSEDKPWMSKTELAILESLLDKHQTVVEFGSGGSTMFISKRVSYLISIEHHEGWAKRVVKELSEAGVDNVLFLFSPPRNAPFDCAFCCANGLDWYGGYVNALANHVPDDFRVDLAFIDGRARPQAAFNMLQYMHKDSTLIIHDYVDRRVVNGGLYYGIVERWFNLILSGAYTSDIGQRRCDMAVFSPKKEFLERGAAMPPSEDEAPWWLKTEIRDFECVVDRFQNDRKTLLQVLTTPISCPDPRGSDAFFHELRMMLEGDQEKAIGMGRDPNGYYAAFFQPDSDGAPVDLPGNLPQEVEAALKETEGGSGTGGEN